MPSLNVLPTEPVNIRTSLLFLLVSQMMICNVTRVYLNKSLAEDLSKQEGCDKSPRS